MSHGISVSFCGIGFSQVETALEAGGEVSAGVEMRRKYVSCVWRQQTEGLEVSLATYARPGKKAYDSPSKLNPQARSMAFQLSCVEVGYLKPGRAFHRHQVCALQAAVSVCPGQPPQAFPLRYSRHAFLY